ncbi:MAG: serine/threonine-protein kinase [Candidatus Zixiibacteriota bacterium]
MSDTDNDKTFREEFPEDKPSDPLGIIGWVIGGKYKVHAHIGGGGFGEVYDAYNINLPEQKLVVKFFKRVQSRDKFAKEAKILCLLDHPNICRIIDFLPEEGAVVMAFINGRDGSAILKSSGALKEELFLKLARAVTNAIAYAHEKKIAHRDIKPSNIIVDQNDNIYLIDFGIAKEMGTDATKTAYQALTPMFAAPERQSGEKDYNPFLSDIYETGVTLFTLATNDMPYRNPVNPNVEEWGGSTARRLSPQLRRILKKATHPDPKKRYRQASELAREMEHLETAFQRPKKFPLVLSLIGLALIIVVAAYLYQDKLTHYWSKYVPKDLFDKKEAPAQPTPPPPVDSAAATVKPAEDTVSIDTAETKQTVKPPTTAAKQPDTLPTTATESKIEEKPAEPKPTPVETRVETPVTTTPAETVKPTPPPTPPPKTRYVVNITPPANSILKIDNQNRPVGQPFDLEPGPHDITVIHPDYPTYHQQVQVSGDADNFTLDLRDKYSTVEEIEIQLGLNPPPSDKHILELYLNGWKQTILSFPVLDLYRRPGEWEIEAKIIVLERDTRRPATVDSCVVFPYGGGPHNVVKGSKGTIKLIADGQDRVPLVIFWNDK